MLDQNMLDHGGQHALLLQLQNMQQGQLGGNSASSLLALNGQMGSHSAEPPQASAGHSGLSSNFMTMQADGANQGNSFAR